MAINIYYKYENQTTFCDFSASMSVSCCLSFLFSLSSCMNFESAMLPLANLSLSSWKRVYWYKFYILEYADRKGAMSKHYVNTEAKLRNRQELRSNLELDISAREGFDDLFLLLRRAICTFSTYCIWFNRHLLNFWWKQLLFAVQTLNGRPMLFVLLVEC